MSIFNREPHEKTAFVFSGGGSRGSYQIGVWRALRKVGIKPDIAVGTSVGSINAALVALNEFDLAEQLWAELQTDDIFDIDTNDYSLTKAAGNLFGISMEEVYGYAKEFFTNGGAGSTGMLALFNKYINEKKLRRSKIEYGLVTAQLPSMVGYKLFKEDIPEGKLTQYIVASASCFPAAQSFEIDGEKFIDGGYWDNMPVGMAISKGARRIIAIDLQAVGKVVEEDIKYAESNLDYTHIYSHFDLGNFLSFNPEVAIRNLRYGYLDGLKAFGKLDGTVYAFKKNSFPVEDLQAVDNLAQIFALDGCEIYTPQTLHQELSMKILDAQVTLHKHPFNIMELNDKLDPKSITAYIAEDLRAKGDSSMFNSKLPNDILGKEIAAARYILKNKLLFN